MKPLVSILIPAFNAQDWIAETLRSAVAQTWPRKEIIVVDDGSTDGTAQIARQFASHEVSVISTANQGVAAARNHAYRLSQGDYIQWLDSDDLLSPDKIERQLVALRATDGPRTLLSAPWAYFFYRTRRASFVCDSLCQDLTPVEWLLRKMGENLHMQTATWLTSRELAEAAGPWDIRLNFDDDGEYFARVLLASQGTRFVPEARVYYRVTGSSRVSYIGGSNRKKDSLLLSMKLHVGYLRSLEESDRVHMACLKYMQTWFDNFCPERPDLVDEMQSLAAELHGHLEPPRLRSKYAWMRPLLGWQTAKLAQRELPQWKSSLLRRWDGFMYRLESRTRSKEKAVRPLRSPRVAKACENFLVSILIPAYNSDKWVEDAIRSALAQTWKRKEIIVVDDGSSDRTLAIARQFKSDQVRVVGREHQGAAATRNHAFQLSRGDFIQWLDADDVLAPDKIERQFAALQGANNRRILLSCPWAYFYYRTRRARFVPTSLWQDLSPVDWLARKMNENLHMQPATWLTSRELAEAAGPWDTRLLSDDDGEYFGRVLLASEGTRFTPDARVFYRVTSSSRLSHIGASDGKKDALLLSMKLHIKYIRSLEDSQKVRQACLAYLRNWYLVFYPERPDLIAELQSMAKELNEQLEVPRLRWKYAWMKPVVGWKVAKWAQTAFPLMRIALVTDWDKAMYRLEALRSANGHPGPAAEIAQLN